ncbi:MAG: hypothetical protein ACKVQU_15050 [Burkholderiales bacterium]
MEIDRFRDCALAYGATRHRWPSPDRLLFDRLAATTEGAAILADVERTDRFLDTWDDGDASSAERIARLSAILTTAIGEKPARSIARRALRWQVGAIAAAILLGFALGFAEGSRGSSADLITQLILGPSSPRGMPL